MKIARVGHLLSLVELTKPKIMVLVMAAGGTALILEGSLLADPTALLLFMVGLYLCGGSANALNQVFERHIDARMTRTYKRRPLPQHRLHPTFALFFSIGIGAAGVLLLGLAFNWLTAVLASLTILFYSLLYTLWLKPTTNQNIVIGGFAGAMAPVGAWAAATGTTAPLPWFIFLIIFFWTPPHFWSLAIRYREDYRRVGLPMLPVTHGVETTFRWVLYYTIILVAVSLLPLFAQFGWIYLGTAVGLGGVFLKQTWQAQKRKDPLAAWGIFRFSLVYLFCILVAMILDKYLSGWRLW